VIPVFFFEGGQLAGVVTSRGRIYATVPPPVAVFAGVQEHSAAQRIFRAAVAAAAAAQRNELAGNYQPAPAAPPRARAAQQLALFGGSGG
jgi:hypothetical protein